MGRRGKIFFFLAVVILQLYCMVFFREVYPFSNFPMYKNRLSETNVNYCEVQVLLDNGEYRPYREYGNTLVDYLFKTQKCIQKPDETQISSDEIEKFLNDYVAGLEGQGRTELREIRVVIKTWQRFKFGNIDRPDTLQVVARRNLKNE